MPNFLETLIVAATRCEKVDFTGERDTFLQKGEGELPFLLSTDLRRLFTGVKASGDPPGFDPAQCFRWEIRGATIRGCLDLRDACLPSGATLGALEFYECVFEEGIWADGAHLQRLHLSHCQIGPRPSDELHKERAEVSLQGIHVENDVRLNAIRAIREDGFLRVDANAARIGTNFVLRQSYLRAPDDPVCQDLLKMPVALNLRNVEIGADLLVRHDVTLRGGCTATGAHIGGDFEAEGLVLHDGLSSGFRKTCRNNKDKFRAALSLVSARIDGDIRFLTGLTGAISSVTGEMRMRSLSLGADLWIRGVVIDADIDESEPFSNLPYAITLQSATVKGNLMVQAAERTSSDSKEEPQGAAEQAAGTEGSESQSTALTTPERKGIVESPASEAKADIKGIFDLLGAEIGGSLWLEGVIRSIRAPGISVGDGLMIDCTIPVRQGEDKDIAKGGGKVGSSAYGQILLGGAEVRGKAFCRVKYEYGNWKPVLRYPEGQLADIPEEHGTGINLNQAIIHADLVLLGTFEYIDGVSLKLEGDLVCNDTYVLYGVNLRKASIGGDCTFSGLRLFSYADDSRLRRSYPPSLSLKDADIRRTLRLQRRSKEVAFQRARIRTPLCYPSFQLIEILARHVVKARERKDESGMQNSSSGIETREDWIACLIGGDEPVDVLSGGSRVFHLRNEKGYLSLNSPEQWEDYLRLFCAYVWADEGAFALVAPSNGAQPYTAADVVPDSGALPVFTGIRIPDSEGNSETEMVTVKTHVRYANSIFESNFEVARKGMITMTEDAFQCKLKPECCPSYLSPYKYGPRAEISDYRQEAAAWEPLNEAALAQLVPEWRTLFDLHAYLQNADVDLTDVSCGTLEDDNGSAWGEEVRIRLENFTYAHTTEDRETRDPGPHWNRICRFSSRFLVLGRRFFLPEQESWCRNLLRSGVPKTDVEERLLWLEQRAYSLSTKRPEPFLPQPYTHLAKVLREQGDEQAARRVEARRLRIESWQRFKHERVGLIMLPFWELFRLFFRYGLSPERALLTFFLCIGIGGCGVHLANRWHLLVQNTTTNVSRLQRTSDGAKPVIPYTSGPGESELPCGSSISELGYAIDVFIPLLNLHQEEHCDVRSSSERDRSPYAAYVQTPGGVDARISSALQAFVGWPFLWAWAKMIYAGLGRIVSSLLLLTVSGVLRKWESR